MTIVQDRRTIMIETLMAVRQLERQSAGQCGDRDVLLELGSHPWWFSSIGGLYRRVFVSSQSELEDLAGAIRALKPAIVALAPSILGALIDRLGDLRDHQVELVITRGERSSRKERDGWSEALGVRVLDEYSSAELGRIAIECPHRRHHLEEDAVYVEVTKKKSPREPGEIIATSLLNQAMPMIRYRQGELTKFVTGGECPCGSAFRAIESPEGPALDSFTLPHGRIITAAQLMDAVESWRLHLGIPAHGTTFRMVQTAVDRIQLVLRPGPQLSEEMHAPIVEHLEKLIGPGVTVDLVLGEIDDPKVIRFQAESAPAG